MKKLLCEKRLNRPHCDKAACGHTVETGRGKESGELVQMESWDNTRIDLFHHLGLLLSYWTCRCLASWSVNKSFL